MWTPHMIWVRSLNRNATSTVYFQHRVSSMRKAFPVSAWQCIGAQRQVHREFCFYFFFTPEIDVEKRDWTAQHLWDELTVSIVLITQHQWLTSLMLLWVQIPAARFKDRVESLPEEWRLLWQIIAHSFRIRWPAFMFGCVHTILCDHILLAM